MGFTSHSKATVPTPPASAAIELFGEKPNISLYPSLHARQAAVTAWKQDIDSFVGVVDYKSDPILSVYLGNVMDEFERYFGEGVVVRRKNTASQYWVFFPDAPTPGAGSNEQRNPELLPVRIPLDRFMELSDGADETALRVLSEDFINKGVPVFVPFDDRVPGDVRATNEALKAKWLETVHGTNIAGLLDKLPLSLGLPAT